MSNFVTCSKWPPRRIIGAFLTVIGVLSQGSIIKEMGPSLGVSIAILIWGYILFLLLQAPDEPKRWRGIPHSLLAVLLYSFLVMLASMGKNTPEPSKLQRADECVARKIAAHDDMTTAAQDCMREAGMTEDEMKGNNLNTLDRIDRMSISERVQWCKESYGSIVKDSSTLDTGCTHIANNWQQVKVDFLKQMKITSSNGGSR